MSIHLTDAAIEAFQQKLEERNTPHAHIRIGVKGSGGCNGFRYVIAYEDNAPREKDIVLFFNGIRVLVDNRSITYLENCTLDYESTLLEHGFKFVNSLEKSKCGCGKSFNI